MIEDSLFLQNTSTTGHGGVLFFNNPISNGAVGEEGNPLDQLDETPICLQMAPLIPGYEATPEAHPSGVFQDFQEGLQIHDSCFANNSTDFASDNNLTAALPKAPTGRITLEASQQSLRHGTRQRR